MAIPPAVIAGYLHHARAVRAEQHLEGLRLQGIPYLDPWERELALRRLAYEAAGLPDADVEARLREDREAGWAADRARLRGALTRGRRSR